MKKIALVLFVAALLVYLGARIASRKPLDSSENQASVAAQTSSGRESPHRTERRALVQNIRYYYDRPVTEEDLEGKTLRELSLMRNTIFARAGNIFHKVWLNEYFSRRSWHKPTGLDPSKLSATDLKNAEIIGAREAGIPREELLGRREELHKFMLAKEWNYGYEIELALISRALGEPVDWDPSFAKRSPLENPNLLDKLITVDLLQDYSRRDLRILRNTIFARHGRSFVSPSLQTYFERMIWYRIDSAYTDARLNEIDRKNLRIILSVEQTHGGPLTEGEHAELELMAMA